MPYITINKKTNRVRLFGSVSALSQNLGIKSSSLYETFGRKKEDEMSTEDYRVLKVETEKAKRVI